mmetsp:Transcript_40798/g.113274  ORF Transcript_40798/g.113274 Transcript_40798/m.113274 type:complete len:178 (-) Transcript_40798:276-809(-)
MAALVVGMGLAPSGKAFAIRGGPQEVRVPQPGADVSAVPELVAAATREMAAKVHQLSMPGDSSITQAILSSYIPSAAAPASVAHALGVVEHALGEIASDLGSAIEEARRRETRSEADVDRDRQRYDPIVRELNAAIAEQTSESRANAASWHARVEMRSQEEAKAEYELRWREKKLDS